MTCFARPFGGLRGERRRGRSLALLILGVVVGCGNVELELLLLFVGPTGQRIYQSTDQGSESRASRTQWKVGWASAAASVVWKYLAEGLAGEGSCLMNPVDLWVWDSGVEGQVAMGQAHSLGQEGGC